MSVWTEAFKVATVGLSIVFITLIVLAATVKIMSLSVRKMEKPRGGK